MKLHILQPPAALADSSVFVGHPSVTLTRVCFLVPWTAASCAAIAIGVILFTVVGLIVVGVSLKTKTELLPGTCTFTSFYCTEECTGTESTGGHGSRCVREEYVAKVRMVFPGAMGSASCNTWEGSIEPCAFDNEASCETCFRGSASYSKLANVSCEARVCEGCNPQDSDEVDCSDSGFALKFEASLFLFMAAGATFVTFSCVAFFLVRGYEARLARSAQQPNGAASTAPTAGGVQMNTFPSGTSTEKAGHASAPGLVGGQQGGVAMVVVACPHCQTHIQAQPGVASTCPACRGQFQS